MEPRRPTIRTRAALRLPEPLTADQAVLRTTLLPGSSRRLARNSTPAPSASRSSRWRASTCRAGSELPEERWHVAGIVQGGFLRAKGAVETLAAAAHVELPFERDRSPARCSILARRHGRRQEQSASSTRRSSTGSGAYFELDLETLARRGAGAGRVRGRDHVPGRQAGPRVRRRRGASRPATLVAAAREAAGPELREMRVFDVYRGEQVGEGRKSIALAARLPVARADALRRGRGDAARADRRRARRALRRRAARLAQSVPVAPRVDRDDAPSGSSSSSGLRGARARSGCGDGADAGRPRSSARSGRGSRSRSRTPTAPVTQLDPGTYEIIVRDLSDEHNFHLIGPGVERVHAGRDDRRR